MAGELWRGTPKRMKKAFPAVGESLMAEKVGFEPTDRLLAGLPDFESGPL